MSEHVTQWLSAYLDGELRGSRLQQVEEHLAGCQECQAELQALQGLSALLQEVPSPEFTSPERLSAQVNLRLPRKLPGSTKRKAQEAGWWLIPVGLLAMWIFMSTIGLVNDAVSTANELGLLSSAPTWLVDSSSAGAYWSGTLGEFGLLSGNSLAWAETMELFTRNTLPDIIWRVSIALLYLGWIAIWWARHTRQEHGRLLEG
jgi:anti-sigma factor RsiW